MEEKLVLNKFQQHKDPYVQKNGMSRKALCMHQRLSLKPLKFNLSLEKTNAHGKHLT